jgi:predicted nucleotidyltransferase
MGKASILNMVRRTVMESLHGLDAAVYLFGSWARGDEVRTSDIDIAVLPRSPLPCGLLARLRDALEESRIPYRIELVDLGTTDLVFRKQVLKEGVRWKA